MQRARAVRSAAKSQGRQCGAYCGIVALRDETFPRVGLQHVACRQAFGRAGHQVRPVPPKPKPTRRAPSALHPSATLPAGRKAAVGHQWLHEIKLDGFRMAARIDNGRVQLLARTGLDWTGKYPSAIEALANLNIKTAYLDGELCGVDEAGLTSFAHTQAATDGERGVRLVYYAFDLLHLGGWDISDLQLIERKALL
jgi:ATP-dependent DNA ligase